MQKIRVRIVLWHEEQMVGAGEEKEKQTWKMEQVGFWVTQRTIPLNIPPSHVHMHTEAKEQNKMETK